MGRILVVDGEDKARDEISKALLSLNPQNKLEVFAKFEDLENHFKNLNEEQQLEYYKFDVVILEYTLVNPTEWEARLKDLKSKIPAEASYCFTSYDNVNVNRKHLQQLHARNIFYKPFDTLILKESLNMALKFKTKVSPVEMRPQITQSSVAILKDVELVSICELGFVTMNEGAIAQFTFSKYLSELFTNGKKQSVWAQCILSLEVPNKPGFFINKFQFVGIESGALMHLRRHLQENKHKKAVNGIWKLDNTKSDKKLTVAIIDTKEDKTNKLKSEIESRFSNLKAEYVIVAADKLAKLEKKYDFVVNLNQELDAEELRELFPQDVKMFLLASGPIKEEDLVKNQPFYSDIFTHPMDRSYFYKKIKIFMQDLEFVELPDMMNLATTEKLKALNMVKLTEICELYLNFTYYRELPLETTRQFAFISEDETQIVELPGFCNFTEKSQKKDEHGKEQFLHQFIFWGMTDHYLKQIRIWLLSNYIQKKQ